VVLGRAPRLHALASLRLDGKSQGEEAPAQETPCDLQGEDALRRLVPSSVHVQRAIRARRAQGRRLAGRPAEDAGGAQGGQEAASAFVEARRPVLGHRVRLGHESSAPARCAGRTGGSLDVRGALPDVAVRCLARDLVRLGGPWRQEPVSERPLLPHELAGTSCAGKAAAHGVPLPLHRVPRAPRHQHLGPGRDEQ
jgi:hypothetical protein